METKKNSKGIIWIIIILTLLILTIGGLFIFKMDLFKSNQKKEHTKYSLKKFADFDFKVSTVGYFDAFDDYIAFEVYGYDGLYESKEKLAIYKNGKEVYLSGDETDILRIEDEHIYYTSTGIINYKNPNKSSDTYDSLNSQGNIFIATKNKKYGLIDSEGKKITEFIYDKIESRDLVSKYLFAVKDNKVGIIDVDGKNIIPIEYEIVVKDFDGYEYNDYGQIIDDENKSYFILRKGNTNYAIDEKNKVILETNEDLYYNYNLEYFYTINNNKYSFYSIDGKLKKEVEINSDWSMGSRDYVSNISSKTKNNFEIFQDSKDENTIYELNKNLELKTYNDVYFYQTDGMDDLVDVYLFNNDLYVANKGGKYQLISKKDSKILEEYEKIYYIELDRLTDQDNIFVACKSEKQCGVLDIEGNSITEFKYKYETINEDSRYGGSGEGILTNENEHIVISGDLNLQTYTCKENNKIDVDVFSAYKNVYYTKNGLFTNNCEKMNEKEIRNYDYLENDYIVAEIKEECSFEDETKCNYYIWDDNNNLITYENKDNATIQLYLGFANNRMYFKTDKGIYFIEI